MGEILKTFTFELKGKDGNQYCFNFECDTIQQLESVFYLCDLVPENYGELIYSEDVDEPF